MSNTTVRLIFETGRPTTEEDAALISDLPRGLITIGYDEHLDTPIPGQVTFELMFPSLSTAQTYISYVQSKVTPISIAIV
jgi:hypothetical protein